MKRCIKCGEIKDLAAFNKNSKIQDGHLNTCRVCTRLYDVVRQKRLQQDPIWAEKERSRVREKYRRLGYSSAQKTNRKLKKKKFEQQYPEKAKAYSKVRRLFHPKGTHRHHWSYNEEHILDVIILSPQDHTTLHRFIEYDMQHRLYRRKDTGELLDTKEKHEVYYQQTCLP